MNDEFRDLEERLKKLSPSPMPPELGHRIERSAERTVGVARSRPRGKISVLSIATALIVVLGVLIWYRIAADKAADDAGPLSVKQSIVEVPTPSENRPIPDQQELSADSVSTLPTAQSYRNVFRESPDQLETLLEVHARTLLSPSPRLSVNELLEESRT